MTLLKLDRVTVSFGGPPVLDAVDLVVEPGERLCVLGRNGSGKSTLLRAFAGRVETDAGTVTRAPGLRVAHLGQQVPEDLRGTVLDVVSAGAVEDHVAKAAISRVGLDPDAPLADLSAGLKRRTLLAGVLATEPDLLLLDEPTNHLDVDAIAWLEGFLGRYRKALVFVTHDRALLRTVATGILDLDRGRLSRFEADYDRYLERKQERRAAEVHAHAVADEKLAEEEVWRRQGVRERRKRNQGRVRRLREMRQARRDRREVQDAVRMDPATAAPSGRLVIRSEDLTFTWDGTPIVEGLSTTIMRGDRIGILGPNGSGKTTLLRLLLGDLAPDSGRVRHGTNLEVGYFDQLHADLDPDATAAQNVIDGGQTVTVNGRTRHIIGYLGDFLFTPQQVRHPVRMFSGGERNRLLLARLFARPSNLLVLDEPTNDLDVETLEVLEDLLAEYPGTILMVSHERELLDHLATGTLVLRGDGVVSEHVGGYASWIEARREQAPPERPRQPARPRKPRPRASLTWKEKREIDGLPARIETLEDERRARHEEMAEPGFYERPGELIARARSELEAIEKEIAAAYARWEELEAKAAGVRRM
jgi:ATP-binding cassette subfamily F protein uup